MPTRAFKPYDGKKTGLVLGIDVGTTYTGVSYAFLEPGKSPEIKTVYGYGIASPLHVFPLTVYTGGQTSKSKRATTESPQLSITERIGDRAGSGT